MKYFFLILVVLFFTSCGTQFDIPEGGYSDFITDNPKVVLKKSPIEKTIEEKNEFVYKIFNWKIGNKVTTTELKDKEGEIDEAVILEAESILRERGHNIAETEKDATSTIVIKSLSFIHNRIIYKQNLFCGHYKSVGQDGYLAAEMQSTPCVTTEFRNIYKTTICLKKEGSDEFCRVKEIQADNNMLAMRDLLKIELHKIAEQCVVGSDCDK